MLGSRGLPLILVSVNKYSTPACVYKSQCLHPSLDLCTATSFLYRDTAGQERFRTLTNALYIGAHARSCEVM